MSTNCHNILWDVKHGRCDQQSYLGQIMDWVGVENI